MNIGDRFVIQSPIPGVESQEVIFQGIQPGVTLEGDSIPDQGLYDLTRDIPEHPAGSTVTKQTLVDLGYILPKEMI